MLGQGQCSARFRVTTTRQFALYYSAPCRFVNYSLTNVFLIPIFITKFEGSLLGFQIYVVQEHIGGGPYISFVRWVATLLCSKLRWTLTTFGVLKNLYAMKGEKADLCGEALLTCRWTRLQRHSLLTLALLPCAPTSSGGRCRFGCGVVNVAVDWFIKEEPHHAAKQPSTPSTALRREPPRALASDLEGYFAQC
jgi:hypothetical protein